MKNFTLLLFMLFLGPGCCLKIQAQSRSPVKVGNTSEVKTQFEAKAKKSKKNAPAQITHKVPGKPPLVLNLKSSKKMGAASAFYGEINNAKNSNFYLKVEGNDVSGSIILREQKKYYKYHSTANGSVFLTEEDIDQVLCVGYQDGSEEPAANSTSKDAGIAAIPDQLESLPGAEAVVLLDFDGETVTNTLWNSNFNNGEPIIAEPANVTEDEIIEVWKLVSEDFRPFALNVTTSEAVFNNAPANRRMRVIITPTNYFYPDAGGVAYLNSFTWGGESYYGETPCWVFNSGIKGMGEAGSHEVGHTLSLAHDGRISPQEEYFDGQDSWAPIMGTSYNRLVAQWSKGEYPQANNQEDDLYNITTYNGFGYRGDDHGNNTSTASPLVIEANGHVSAAANKGVISTRSDTDVFSFTTDGGPIALSANPDPDYPNLDIMLSLLSADGTVIASDDSPALSASVNEDLASGTYFLVIDGIKGNLGANSDYASLGSYSISTSAYRDPIYTDGCTSFATQINHFSFHTLENNNSGCNNGNAVGYTNYAPVENLTTSVKIGQSYSLSMQSGTVNGQYFGVWIDYNLDKDFDDEGEFVYASPSRSSDSFSATITIPPTAKQGSTRMRVRSAWSPMITSAYSWSSMTYGEAEDYTITIGGNEAPLVNIASPAEGESFKAPATIMVEAQASDGDGTVEKVEFFNGDTKLGEDAEAPYSFSWSNVASGSYHLTAKATDNSGASTTSDPVTVSVTENQTPVVSIASPAEGESFMAPASINIAVDANDEDGTVKMVEFFNGDTKLGEDMEAPYSFSWSNVASGSYSLTAKATDNSGASSTSDPVTVSVIEGSNQSPVVSITSPTDGFTLTIPQNPIHIVANAFDPDGSIAKVEFFNGTKKIGEVHKAPYTYNWKQPHKGTYSITVRATDNLGASTSSDAVLVTVTLPGNGNSKDKEKGKDKDKNKNKNKKSISGMVSSTGLEAFEVMDPKVYPNPVSAQSILKVDMQTEFAELKIVLHESSTGKIVHEGAFKNTPVVQLDVSHLAYGLYTVTITAEDNVWIKKFIVLP